MPAMYSFTSYSSISLSSTRLFITLTVVLPLLCFAFVVPLLLLVVVIVVVTFLLFVAFCTDAAMAATAVDAKDSVGEVEDDVPVMFVVLFC